MTITLPRRVGVPIKAEPLSAEMIVEDNPLPSAGSPGSHRRRRALVYRNSEGKTRVEILAPKEGHQGERSVIAELTDPGAGISDILDSQNRVDHRVTLERMGFMMAGGCCPEKMIALQSAETFLLTAAEKPIPSLGLGSRGDSFSPEPIQRIEGIIVEGYGEKLTSPKGAQGNKQAIVFTIKSWYAPEIKLTMFIEISDSRYGESKIRLINIKMGEPKATLFKLPPGYRTVEEKDTFTIR